MPAKRLNQQIPIFWLLLLLCTQCVASVEFTLGLSEENAGIIDYHRGSFQGVMAESVNCVLDNFPGRINVVKAPLARLLKMLEDGELDVAAPLLEAPERDQYSQYAGRLDPLNMLLVYASEHSDVDIEIIKERLINQGYVTKRGSHTRTLLSTATGLSNKDISVVEQNVSTWGNALEMVKLGRAACTIVPEHLVEDDDNIQVTNLKHTSVSTVYPSFYVSHQREDLQQRFVQATSSCIKNK